MKLILCTIIIIYICGLILSPRRYIKYLPSIKIYPNNEKESKIVENESKSRTPFDISFFKKTDKSIVIVFHELLPQYSEKELRNEIFKINKIIFFLKYVINRARPHQINNNIPLLKSTTANTPSYPAGHAFQAYYLANYLGKKHPEKKYELDKLAYKCDIVRVKAGLHYPSDGKFSKQIVNLLFNH